MACKDCPPAGGTFRMGQSSPLGTDIVSDDVAAAEQPAPTKNEERCIQDLVIQDIQTRKAIGLERYGTLLQPFNGRDALVDAYQEALDLCQYLRQVIEERDRAKTASVFRAATDEPTGR
jgi:hypothetical protein